MTDERGMTLMEIIIVMALGSMVLVAVMSLTVNMSRSSLRESGSQSRQVGSAYAVDVLERELRQATVVMQPAPGAPTTVLEGCANAADLSGNGGALSPLDATAPMRWFAFCGVDGRVYYHAGDGCPAAYSCGSRAAMTFGGPATPAAIRFTRASRASAVVDYELSMKAGEETGVARGGVAYNAAVGSTQ